MEIKKINKEINNVKDDNLKALAQLFPSVIKDGKLDIEALKEELGEYEEVNKKEKYELTWSGKQRAKQNYQEDVHNKTLKYFENESKNADTTENIYIEGDNLEVLKLLRSNYYNSIKMIYIDPPYNTGNDFVYNDDFSMSKEQSDLAEGLVNEAGERLEKNQKTSNKYHANWLNMMYPRLKLARDLLTDDGVIFISIGEEEINNLITVMNEIFNEENKVGIISRTMKSGGGKGKYFSPNIEYILVYAKNKENLNNFREELSEELIKKVYNNIEKEGVRKGERYAIKGLCQPGLGIRPNQRYWVEAPDGSYIIPKGKTFPDNLKDGEKVLPNSEDTCWRWSCQRYLEEKEKGNIEIRESTTAEALVDEKKQKSKWNVFTKIWLSERLEEGKVPVNYIGKWENRISSKELKELKIPFDFAKPMELLKYLITIANFDKNIIILDFFSGSATTAHAVMQLNSEDNGNRKYIMVQLPELTYSSKKQKYKDENGIEKEKDIIDKETNYPVVDKDSEVRKAGYYTIAEIGKERIRRAGEKIKQEIEEYNNNLKLGEEPKKIPDIGFKVFKVDKTNIKWNNIENIDIDNIQLASPDIIDFELGTNDIDVVYELMLRQRDVKLSETIEVLNNIGNRTYLYASSYLVCLETTITVEIIEKLAELDPLPTKFIFRDSAFKDDIALKDETFRRLEILVKRNHEKNSIYGVEFI